MLGISALFMLLQTLTRFFNITPDTAAPLSLGTTTNRGRFSTKDGMVRIDETGKNIVYSSPEDLLTEATLPRERRVRAEGRLDPVGIEPGDLLVLAAQRDGLDGGDQFGEFRPGGPEAVLEQPSPGRERRNALG